MASWLCLASFHSDTLDRRGLAPGASSLPQSLRTYIVAGWLERTRELRYLLVLGRDASGVIEAVGEGMNDISVGAEVLAYVPLRGPFEAGTSAEFAVVDTAYVAAEPEDLDYVAAAAFPLTSGTAQAVVDAIGSQPG